MGAGGLGGYWGGVWARAGQEVPFIARGVHLEAIRRQGGLTVRAVDGEWFASAAAADAPAGHPPDLILFTVKSYDTETAAELVRPAVGPETALLSLQNGVDNEETLARRYGADRVLGGLVYILATIQAPGVVQQYAGPRAAVQAPLLPQARRARAGPPACLRALVPVSTPSSSLSMGQSAIPATGI